MFQSHQSDQAKSQLWTTIIILVAILAAVAVTLWLILELQREQATIDELLGAATPHIAGSL